MAGGALRCVKLFEDICGTTFLANTALITTMWDKYPEDFGVAEETERDLINQYWHPFLAVRQNTDGAGVVEILSDNNNNVVKLDPDITFRDNPTGAMYARSNNTKEIFENILREILGKQPLTPKLQKELTEGTSLDQTTAGKRLKKELDENKNGMQMMQGNMDEAVPDDKVQPAEVEGEEANTEEIVAVGDVGGETAPLANTPTVSSIMSISAIREDFG